MKEGGAALLCHLLLHLRESQRGLAGIVHQPSVDDEQQHHPHIAWKEVPQLPLETVERCCSRCRPAQPVQRRCLWISGTPPGSTHALVQAPSRPPGPSTLHQPPPPHLNGPGGSYRYNMCKITLSRKVCITYTTSAKYNKQIPMSLVDNSWQNLMLIRKNR